MEKTSILDFISKLSGLPVSENAASSEEGMNNNTYSAIQAPVKSQEKTEENRESFMRSYNPFSVVQTDRKQITSPRTTKPPKNTIDLKNGKNLATEKKNEHSSDMIRFINRHNDLAKRFDKKND